MNGHGKLAETKNHSQQPIGLLHLNKGLRLLSLPI